MYEIYMYFTVIDDPSIKQVLVSCTQRTYERSSELLSYKIEPTKYGPYIPKSYDAFGPLS